MIRCAAFYMRMPRSARSFAVTSLDAAVIILLGAAVALWLGAVTRFVVHGVHVRLVDPWRPALAAAVLLLARLALDRRAPPLPSLHGLAPMADDERVRMERPEPVSGRVATYAVLVVAGSIVWILPQLFHLHHVPDAGDPIFSAWRIAAFAHQLATDPRHLWNGNIFYPLPLTITYSDSLFLQSLVGLPFLLARADPLVVANALMVISFPARGLAFFYATWRFTGDPQAALVAALVAAWSPFYPQHYSQLELNWSMFVPLAFVALLRALARPGWRSGVLLGAAVAAQCLACMYIAVMLVSALVPFTIVMGVAWRVRPSAAAGRTAAGAAVTLLPIVAILGVPYIQSREAHGERSVQEVSDGSASPRDYADAHIRLVTYQWQSGRYHHVERELFPGTSSFALSAAAIVPPLTPVSIATLVTGAFAFDWSLGLRGLTYPHLYKNSAVYRGMRVAARFAAMVDAMLAMLAAYGARRLLRLARASRTRGIACAILCGGVLFDLHMDPRLQPYIAEVPRIYRSVTPDMVLAEMPDGHVLDSMYFSTRHWARLLDGYSGYFPSAPDFDRAKREFPSPQAIAILRQRGATHVTYNCAWEKYPWRCENVMLELAANPSLELVASDRRHGPPVALYRLR
jgi:hypothetical protein